MGWWRNEDGDQLGDEPADLVSQHLETLARARRPPLEELLRHLQEVLAHKTNDLCSPGEDQPLGEIAPDRYVEVEPDWSVREIRAVFENYKDLHMPCK